MTEAGSISAFAQENIFTPIEMDFVLFRTPAGSVSIRSNKTSPTVLQPTRNTP